MPIFEYECVSCKHRFEHLVFSGDEERQPACRKCGGTDVVKLMSCTNTLGGDKTTLCSPGSSRFT
ncbi:MAG: zinc ribbon domain-containing protein [Syntrophales bacterium]|jgi:putative FmdB family regulatory protein|nr:zinc ribbon domain-containing protein [Syntrophales bacterium]MCK9528914.1 zinc ribbon domain-containing protein [Syntrophales bacterium]MDX9922522.1 zinc ribbon domain-containing protein [Syntrophales bacterium]